MHLPSGPIIGFKQAPRDILEVADRAESRKDGPGNFGSGMELRLAQEGMVAFRFSDNGAHINGQTILVDGGGNPM